MEFICEFCGKDRPTAKGLKCHINQCHSNPNRVVRKIWSKGLTKADDPRIAVHAQLLSDKYANGLRTGFVANRQKHLLASKRGGTKSGGYRAKAGRGKYGYYKGHWCQSLWEMAWVIYHLDHGIQFSRNHGAFHYEYGGKIRRYYPDFIVAGVYIEVKGFDSPQFQAKLACFHNQIQVLYEKDMQPIFEYVRSTYGNDLSSLYDKDGE